MRQAYLELAVLYLASSGQIVMKENSVLEAVITDDDESVASKDSTKKRKRPQVSCAKNEFMSCPDKIVLR